MAVLRTIAEKLNADARENCETNHATVHGQQQGLPFDDRYVRETETDAIYTEIARIVSLTGPKQVCFDLDIAPTTLTNSVNRRDRHHLKIDWLTYFLRHDNTYALLSAIANAQCCDLKPRQELTDSDKWRRMEQALDKLPDTIKAALYREAFGGK